MLTEYLFLGRIPYSFTVTSHFRYDTVSLAFFALFGLLLFSIFFMERKGKAVATTSAQNQGGHNGDGDDERKRKEADEAYRRLQIRKAEKAIAELLHNLTKDDHLLPRSPSQKEWLNVTRKVCDDICSELGVKPETRRASVNGLCVDLSTSKRNSSHFLQFIDEMLKSLS